MWIYYNLFLLILSSIGPTLSKKDIIPEVQTGCISWNGTLKTEKGSCFHCLDKQKTIDAEQVCDGAINCEDFSDECLCENITIPSSVCEVLYDPGVVPESVCWKEHGDFSCGDGSCINRTKVCDDKQDCKNGMDEMYCPPKTSLQKNTMNCSKGFGNDNVETTEAVLCDGIPECDNGSDECNDKCIIQGSLPNVCNPKLACVPMSMICDGKWDSQNLALCNKTRITEEENNCNGRFYCPSKGKISISMHQVCDDVIDCDDGRDEDQSGMCGGTENQPDKLRDARLELKKSRWDHDCDDLGWDACDTDDIPTFSSEVEMIGNKPLRYLVWIVAIIGLIGNISVVIFTLWVLSGAYKKLNVIELGHHSQLLNLSMSDLAMSVYLLAIAIQSAIFSGKYGEADLSWRYSDTCSALGALALISSETSVTLMVVMSIFRFASIYKPFMTSYSTKTNKLIRSTIVFAWAVSIMFGIMPLIEPIKLHFVTDVVVSCPIFESDVVDIRSFTNVSERIATYIRRTSLSESFGFSLDTTSVVGLGEIYHITCPQSESLHWLGFYSQNSVCLPRLFASTDDAAWEYSLIFLIYNFTAFLIMLFSYGFIIKIAYDSSKKSGVDKMAPRCEMQKRVTRLLASDFLCWIPICVIGFIYSSGVHIYPIVYAVCGIVLIPLNSALNPVLYSSISDRICKMVRNLGCCSHFAKSEKCGVSKMSPSYSGSSQQPTYHKRMDTIQQA